MVDHQQTSLLVDVSLLTMDLDLFTWSIQVCISAVENVWAKQNFEKLCLDHRVILNNYLADNGVFKANSSVQHIYEHQQ